MGEQYAFIVDPKTELPDWSKYRQPTTQETIEISLMTTAGVYLASLVQLLTLTHEGEEAELVERLTPLSREVEKISARVDAWWRGLEL